MAKITKISALKNPQFVKPIAIEYEQDGVLKKWEAVITHDSVAILLYHQEKKAFVIVKQLRAPVLHATQTDGYMHELCAGIVDKEMPLVQVAQEEILEECGYDVPVDNLQKVSSFFTSVGISGSKQTLYYANINESMKINEGGGIEEEAIEVLYIPLHDAKKFLFDESFQKTPGMMMAFYWFFEKKLHKV